MSYFRTVRLADTDAAGVVYFASLLSMCHETYEASLEEFNLSVRGFLQDGLALPIVHAEIDFFRPLFCGDRSEILITPRQLSENEFEIDYRVLVGSDCIAIAKTRHVCINPNTRRREPIPELMVKWLNKTGT